MTEETKILVTEFDIFAVTTKNFLLPSSALIKILYPSCYILLLEDVEMEICHMVECGSLKRVKQLRFNKRQKWWQGNAYVCFHKSQTKIFLP